MLVDGAHLVIEVLVDGADWLQDVDRWRCVLVFLEPLVQQRRVVLVLLDDVIHQLELVGRYDGRYRTVAVFLTQEHLQSAWCVVQSHKLFIPTLCAYGTTNKCKSTNPLP